MWLISRDERRGDVASKRQQVVKREGHDHPVGEGQPAQEQQCGSRQDEVEVFPWNEKGLQQPPREHQGQQGGAQDRQKGDYEPGSQLLKALYGGQPLASQFSASVRLQSSSLPL